MDSGAPQSANGAPQSAFDKIMRLVRVLLLGVAAVVSVQFLQQLNAPLWLLALTVFCCVVLAILLDRPIRWGAAAFVFLLWAASVGGWVISPAHQPSAASDGAKPAAEAPPTNGAKPDPATPPVTTAPASGSAPATPPVRNATPSAVAARPPRITPGSESRAKAPSTFTLTLNLAADSSCEQWGRRAGELSGAERNLLDAFQSSVEEATGLLERLVKADPSNTADYMTAIDQWGHSRVNMIEHAYGSRGGVDFRTAEPRDDILDQIPTEVRQRLNEGQIRELRRTSGRLSCLRAIQDNLSRRANQKAPVTPSILIEDLAERLLKGSELLRAVETAEPAQFTSDAAAWRNGVLVSLRNSGRNAEAAIFESRTIPPLPRLVAPGNAANRQTWNGLVIDTTNLRNLISELRR